MPKTGSWELDADIVAKLADATLQGTAKFAIKIETLTPYYWCSGHNPVTIGGDVFTPKGMKVPELTIGTTDSRSSLIVEDVSSALETQNYTERFSALQTEWYLGMVVGGVWQQIYALTWSIQQTHWRLGQFRFALAGGVGTYPRSGLPVFSRRCCLTFKGTHCASGPKAGNYTTAKTCDGSEANCEERHVLGGGSASASYILPFLGMPYAPEVGEVMVLKSPSMGDGGSSYTFGPGNTDGDQDKPGGWDRGSVPSADPNLNPNQPIGDFDAGLASAVGEFIESAVT